MMGMKGISVPSAGYHSIVQTVKNILLSSAQSNRVFALLDNFSMCGKVVGSLSVV